MKKGDKKFVSFITTIALTTTMVINGTAAITSASDNNEEKLKAAVEEAFDSYLEENSQKIKDQETKAKEANEN